MENKKTISYLNSKAWYRLLKVLYIVIVVLLCILFTSLAFEEVGSYQTDYTVKCNYGNRSTFLAYKDKDIYISPLIQYDKSLAKLSDYSKVQLQSACDISKEEISKKMSGIIFGTDDGKGFFELNQTKVVTDTYLTASLWSILAIAVVFVFFILIKMAFYYILLGSVRPKK
jgi:hypothetical protein